MEIKFSFLTKEKEYNIPVDFKKIVKEIGRIEKKKFGEICFIFVSRKKILAINRQFLKHDYFTDVITFNNSVKEIFSGDIFVCPAEVLKNAKEIGVLMDVELIRVMIHGVLHLVGYKDESMHDVEIMRRKEDLYIFYARKFVHE